MKVQNQLDEHSHAGPEEHFLALNLYDNMGMKRKERERGWGENLKEKEERRVKAENSFTKKMKKEERKGGRKEW